MKQILNAATNTKTTDVVFIPVGMGVFLTHKREEMKAEMLSGWIEELNAYQEPHITLRCCLMPGQFELIQKHVNNPNITLSNHHGQDAYTVANAIQDQPGKKSMLINAGDHDWLVSLKKNNRPGECFKGHTLFNSTSDEYFALMTQFSAFSIPNLQKHFKSLKQFIFSMAQPTVEINKEIKVEIGKQADKTNTQKHEAKEKLKADVKQYETQFNTLMLELGIIRDALIETAQTDGQYKTVASSVNYLYQTLNEQTSAFFTKPSGSKYLSTQVHCKAAMDTAAKESATHRGWHGVDPIIRGILGVLAAIAVIPALVVEMNSKHGFAQTFFTTPETETSKKLAAFKLKFDEVYGRFEQLENEETKNLKTK